MKKASYLVIVVLLCFISCDSYHIAQGIVIDKETKLPLSNVEVYSKHRHEAKTDSVGHFNLSYVTGYKTPHVIYIEHEGYKPLEVKFKNRKEQIVEIEEIK